MSLFVTHIQSQVDAKPPPTVVLNLVEANSTSVFHSANGAATHNTYTPASTKKLVLCSQRLPSDTTYNGATRFSGCLLSQEKISYSAQVIPVTDYTVEDNTRKYMDVYSDNWLSGRSCFDTGTEWSLSPISVHAFSKSPDVIDTNAVVKFFGDGATTPSNIWVTSIYSSLLVLNYDSSGQVSAVNYAIES